MAGDGIRLEDQLCFSLYAATRAMTAAYGPLLEELDLTYPQYLVMLVLWERDGARVSDIGEQLYLDSGTLTPLIKRLETRKLVERRRSAEDERAVEIHLTAAGKRMRKQAARIPQEMFQKSCLSVPELIKLRYQLHELTAKLRG